MLTDIGEYLVGAYLRLVEKCDFVAYNVRTPGGGRDGLNELDVLGLNSQTRVTYLCEVTTHIRGLLYRSNPETISRIRAKYDWQRRYVGRYLRNFSPVYQFWSPVVPKGYLTAHLVQIAGLEPIINGEYTQRVRTLQELAKRQTQDTQNPVFRVFQILEHLRE